MVAVTKTSGIRTTIRMGALLLALGSGGCVVTETRDDILGQAWRCESDVDCVEGWECRAFALNPSANQRFCVLPCGSDDTCLFDDVCGNEGFCVEPCDLASPFCRDPKLACLRWNLTPGSQEGICQPAVPCDSSSDCAAPYDQCLASVLMGAMDDVPLQTDQTACMASCAVEQPCPEGTSCLSAVLELITASETVPEVCTPRCGLDNACPDGSRCLLDALDELYPGHSFDGNTYKICVPGLSGSGLPCRHDRDCLTGHCVKHPFRLLPGGSDYRTCALPCDTMCDDLRTDCLVAERNGEVGGYCFQPFSLCENNGQCTAPEQCFDLSQIKAGSVCLQPCEGPRDPSCPAGYTCIPAANNTPGSPRYGCFFGLPGFPCADQAQCHQGWGESTECLSPTGDAGDSICTKPCASNADCAFGAVTGSAPYCASDAPNPVCQTIQFLCDDPTMPYECTGTLGCYHMAGPSSPRLCTAACPGVRAATHNCPTGQACAPLVQSASVIANACLVGYPALVPCRRDSECHDAYRDSSQRCLSVTGAPLAEDGVCSVPCTSDEACSLLLDGDGLIQAFCLPGSPDLEAGARGYCYGNPSLEVLLGLAEGRQGTFCGDLRAPQVTCAQQHECVGPLRKSVGILDSASAEFCAKLCQQPEDCPLVPTSHECAKRGALDDKLRCRPTQDDFGRGFGEPCVDHRQCRWGICFRERATDLAYCTKLCDPLQGCSSPEFPDARCPAAFQVCTP